MLRCVSPYRADKLAYGVGDVIDNPALEAHLLHDSPRSFEVLSAEPERPAVETKAIAAAPADKMLRTSAKKGGKA